MSLVRSSFHSTKTVRMEEDRASTRVAHIEKYICTYVHKAGLDYFWFYDQAICPQYIRVGCTMVQGPAGHLSRATRSRA